MATTAVSTMAQRPSWKLTGAAAAIIDQTERPELSELPKLPCSRFHR